MFFFYVFFVMFEQFELVVIFLFLAFSFYYALKKRVNPLYVFLGIFFSFLSYLVRLPLHVSLWYFEIDFQLLSASLLGVIVFGVLVKLFSSYLFMKRFLKISSVKKGLAFALGFSFFEVFIFHFVSLFDSIFSFFSFPFSFSEIFAVETFGFIMLLVVYLVNSAGIALVVLSAMHKKKKFLLFYSFFLFFSLEIFFVLDGFNKFLLGSIIVIFSSAIFFSKSRFFVVV